MFKSHYLGGCALVAFVVAATPGVALAQDGGRGAPAASEDAFADIVVTATRRQQSVQKVTATIHVATPEKLAASNITNGQGLEKLVPGVAATTSGGINAFLRGIGTFQAGFNEGAVGFYIDGIYMPTASAVLTSFNSLERIEVLKGPQGTLYGRNTTGGLINVVTRTPSDVLTMDASLGYANYDTFTQNLYASGPLADDVKASIAVYHQKQAKGWSTNIVTGNDVQKSEDTGVYAKLQWEPGADTKITLSGIYTDSDSNKGFAYAILKGTFGTDGTPYAGKRKISSRLDPEAPYNSRLVSLRLDQDLGFAKFFSLTAYQRSEQTDNINQNGIIGQAVPGRSAQNVYVDVDTRTISQEFQLSSNGEPGAAFDWIVGAYYYNNKLDVASSVYTTCVGAICAPLPGGVPPLLTSTKSPTKSYSGYADGTYHVTSNTHLTVGLRYTHETNSFSGVVTPFSGIGSPFGALPNAATTLPPSVVTSRPASVPPSVTAKKLTYRAVLAQDLADNVHAYISYNKGFKSGLYNQLSVSGRPVLPEVLEAYEAGIKSELFDRRLKFNIAAFHYDYTNAHVRSNTGLPQGSQPVLQNAAAAKIKGVDVEVDLRATDNLSFNGGFEILDAKYTRYPGTTCVVGPVVPNGVLLGGIITTPCDLGGSRLPIAPKFSFVAGATYTIPTAVGPIALTVNDSYKSSYFHNGNGFKQNAHHIVDASVLWTSPSKSFSGRLFVANLTNAYVSQAGQAATTFVYVPGAPRTYGVTLGYHF